MDSIAINARIKRQVNAGTHRAKKYNCQNTLTYAEWVNVLALSMGRCYYCGEFVGTEALTVDHVKPMHSGGSHSADNVVACCMTCNVQKNADDFLNPVWRSAILDARGRDKIPVTELRPGMYIMYAPRIAGTLTEIKYSASRNRVDLHIINAEGLEVIRQVWPTSKFVAYWSDKRQGEAR